MLWLSNIISCFVILSSEPYYCWSTEFVCIGGKYLLITSHCTSGILTNIIILWYIVIPYNNIKNNNNHSNLPEGNVVLSGIMVTFVKATLVPVTISVNPESFYFQLLQIRFVHVFCQTLVPVSVDYHHWTFVHATFVQATFALLTIFNPTNYCIS